MGEQTRGEAELLSDLNEFVRQSANLQSEVPETSGIRPHPLVESTEQTLDTTRFGFGFGPKPSSDVTPESGGPPTPMGACCDSGEGCTIRTEHQCIHDGFTYQGNGTVCDPNPCAQIGACCFHDGSCIIESAADCALGGGAFAGFGTTCVECAHCPDCYCVDASPFEDGLGGYWTTVDVDCDGNTTYSGATTFDARYIRINSISVCCADETTLTSTEWAFCDSVFCDNTFSCDPPDCNLPCSGPSSNHQQVVDRADPPCS